MKQRENKDNKTVFTLIGFAIIMALFLLSVNLASKGSTGRQKESLARALQRDVTYCYATTGRYPKNLDYVERVYGLSYDKDLFLVDYKITGSRIPPEITITVKGASSALDE